MNREITQILSKLILPDHTIRVKLLGDSITHGVGGTGFQQNGEPITQGFARNPDGICWAKLFKEYMEDRYDCQVINNACTGTNIEFIIRNFDELVDAEDDIILCTIGTNNRHQYFNTGEKRSRREQMELVYRDILTLHEKMQAAGKDVIFIANIPASAANERDGADYWRILHMDDIHDLYSKASAVCGFPMISMYNAFSAYCEDRNIPLDSLLADGLHPNDEGYRVMFRLLLRELGLVQRM